MGCGGLVIYTIYTMFNKEVAYTKGVNIIIRILISQDEIMIMLTDAGMFARKIWQNWFYLWKINCLAI